MRNLNELSAAAVVRGWARVRSLDRSFWRPATSPGRHSDIRRTAASDRGLQCGSGVHRHSPVQSGNLNLAWGTFAIGVGRTRAPLRTPARASPCQRLPICSVPARSKHCGHLGNSFDSLNQTLHQRIEDTIHFTHSPVKWRTVLTLNFVYRCTSENRQAWARGYHHRRGAPDISGFLGFSIFRRHFQTKRTPSQAEAVASTINTQHQEMAGQRATGYWSIRCCRRQLPTRQLYCAHFPPAAKLHGADDPWEALCHV